MLYEQPSTTKQVSTGNIVDMVCNSPGMQMHSQCADKSSATINTHGRLFATRFVDELVPGRANPFGHYFGEQLRSQYVPPDPTLTSQPSS